jgi:AbrB family looped-hinge helix DNA binding protein
MSIKNWDEFYELEALVREAVLKTYATQKGQIVIPATLRRKYGIKSGTRIFVTDIGNAIVLKPMTERYLRNLQGSLRGRGGLKVLLEERRENEQGE